MHITSITYQPIGIIRTSFKDVTGMPIQPCGANGVTGGLYIYPEFIDGLKDIEGFSHLILIYHFHKITHWEPEVVPFMDTNKHGIFATRAPSRPNPVGISIVKLISRNDNLLNVEEIDILDGTPLIDIKPFYGLYDNRKEYFSGWLETIKDKSDALIIRSDTRFKQDI
jgi:tRNA (adenine37-N6)-methyltransferase